MAKGKSRKIPQRMCVSCREMKERKALFRIVLQEDGPKLDETGKLMGRGAYICRQEACVEDAFGRKRLAHHLKTPMPEGLYAEVKAALTRHRKAQERAEGKRTFRIGADGQVLGNGETDV